MKDGPLALQRINEKDVGIQAVLFSVPNGALAAVAGVGHELLRSPSGIDLNPLHHGQQVRNLADLVTHSKRGRTHLHHEAIAMRLLLACILRKGLSMPILPGRTIADCRHGVLVSTTCCPARQGLMARKANGCLQTPGYASAVSFRWETGWQPHGQKNLAGELWNDAAARKMLKSLCLGLHEPIRSHQAAAVMRRRRSNGSRLRN